MYDEPETAVREKALELLSFREHSRKELEDKLVSRRFPREVVIDVVDGLSRTGIVDDRRFAEQFVRSRIRTKPHGRSGLVSMLRVRGLALEEAAGVVEDIFREEGVSERDLAWRVVGRAGTNKSRRSDPGALKRMSAMLVRRGFEMDVIREIVGELELMSGSSTGDE